MRRTEEPESWVVYRMTVTGKLNGTHAVCDQAEWDAIEALGAGLYGNFTVTTDPAIVSRMYSPETIARLAEVKRRHDPQNRFCRNHNVAPS